MQLTLRTGVSQLQIRVAAAAGNAYYVSPIGTGDGSIGDPWGIPDLFTVSGSTVMPGAALTILQPGDTLYFRGGDYHINGPAVGTTYQLISPTVSGTSGQPITLRSYPGETVTIIEDTGINPVFGTYFPTLNYVRFLGFIISTTVDPAQSNMVGSGFHISGIGCEVAYCEFVGHALTTSDNHDGIRIDDAEAAWIHHNNVHGVTTSVGAQNSCGIEIYKSHNLIVEDNYLHGNNSNLFDKDSGAIVQPNNNTFRRNWLTAPAVNSFLGNNQGPAALYYIYDNVIDGAGGAVPFSLNESSFGPVSGAQIYNNLIRAFTSQILGQQPNCTQLQVWNNIGLFNDSGGVTSIWDGNEVFVPSGGTAQFSYLDYNVYDGAPIYHFSDGDRSLANMRTAGFENSSTQDMRANIFVDQVAYVLKTAYQTAGRGGSYAAFVGPGVSTVPGAGSPITTAQIIDVTRYGPTAIGSYV